MFWKRKTKKIIRVRVGFIPYRLSPTDYDTWYAVDRDGNIWISEEAIKKYCTFRTIQEALIALEDEEEEKEVWNNLMGTDSCAD